MSKYFFVQSASSSGGHYVAVFPEDRSVAAFDYITNSPITFLALYEGEWSGLGEFPSPTKLKYVTNKESLINISYKLNKQISKILDPQTLLAKIDRCLFKEGYDSVTINFKDYQELFIKNSDKISKRYEPETNKDMIAYGFGGYLHGPNGESPKVVKMSTLVETTKVSANKEI